MPAARDRDWSGPVATLGIAAYFILVLYAIVEKRFLFADGAYYVVRVLEHQGLHEGSRSFSRVFANAVNQAPVLAAMKLGVRDFDALQYIYGLGLYLPYIVCVGIWVWVTRQHKEPRLFLLLFLFAGVTTNDFFIISQTHVASAFYFSVLALMLYRVPWGWGTAMLAAVLAVPLLRAYESMVFFGPLLATVALWRGGLCHNRVCRVGWLVLTLWCLAGAGIALLGIIHPTDFSESQFSGFVSSARELLVRHMLAGLWGKLNLHYGGMLAMIGIGLIALSFVRSRRIERFWRVALVLYAIASLLLFLSLIAFPGFMEIGLHYKGRVLNTAIPALLGMAMFSIRVGLIAATEDVWKKSVSVVVVLALFQFGWQMLGTRQWAGYLDVFRDQMSQNSGLVPVKETVLTKRRVG